MLKTKLNDSVLHAMIYALLRRGVVAKTVVVERELLAEFYVKPTQQDIDDMLDVVRMDSKECDPSIIPFDVGY